jgi:hypothetical protein
MDLVALCLVLLLAGRPASAAEGALPTRGADAVSSTLVRCGDRHVFEMELAKGETLRVRVALADAGSPPELRVLTEDRLDVTNRANVRFDGKALVAGPMRATASGVYSVTLTSWSTHDLEYELRTAVKALPRRSARLAANGRPTTVLASAGATIALVAKDGATPRVTVGFPGEAPRELVPGDPALAALCGSGLAAPCSGAYTFALGERVKAKVVVAPPVASAGASDFPALPKDEETRTWYPVAGWVAASAASGETWAAPLTQLVAAPAPTPTSASLADEETPLGPSGSLGMPLAGAPTLDEVYAAAATASGGYYRFVADRGDLGDVSYVVRFTVDGRASAAPLSLENGRVAMTWTVTSAAAYHFGRWTLAFDPARGAQVLDGSEQISDLAGRTTSVAARGFVLSDTATAGSLSFSYDDPRGSSQARRETYDAAGVRIEAGPTLSSPGEVSAR